MATSNVSTPENIRLGVCKITFGGVDLGLTKGGVDVEVTTETHVVEVDQFGKSPVDEYIMGRKVSAKVPLAETTLENLVRIMPGATLVEDGVKANGTVTFSTAPTANDTVTVNGVVFTAKAVPVNAHEFALGASAAEAAANLKAKLSAAADVAVDKAVYTVSGAIVTATYATSGTDGNAFTLAKSGTAVAVSGATLTGGTNSTHKKVVVKHGIGESLLKSSKKLVLHPIALDDADLSEDFIILKANTPGAMQFAYKLEEERIFNTTFNGYPDPTTKELFVYGDETATAA